MTTETELKLSLSPRVAARILAHPALAAAAVEPVREARLLSVYYDTPKLDLWSAAACVRLRQTPSGWMQTVKHGGTATGGLHQRDELEASVPGQSLDFEAMNAQAAVAQLASERFRRRIRPVFVTEFRRSTQRLRLDTGTEVELSLDRGHIIAGTARVPICEIELELKSGDVLGLFEIARSLLRDFRLRPEYRSKAQRGYVLAGWTETALKAPKIALEETLTLGQAGARIIASCLAQIQANEAGMLIGEDIEYLHQMRVGVRRLRSCLGIFARALDAGELDPVRAELKWLGKRLGPARDWDVFVVDRLPELKRGLAEVLPASELEKLADASAEQRAAAQRSSRAAVASRRTALLLLELGCLAAGGGILRTAEPLQASVKPFASALLERRMQRLLARVDRHKPRTAAELHALRIAVKKLRYAVEFFAPLYDGAKAKPFRDRLARLQDCLGRINDAHSMLGHARAASGGASHLVDCLAGWSAHFVYEERAGFRTLWQEFRRSRAFW